MEIEAAVDTNPDDALVEEMGYKPLLHRGLGAVMNFAFAFNEIACLSSVAIVFSIGVNGGGPATLFWGFVVAFTMSMIVSMCMAEICSAYPTAGSVYHWAGMLVPPKYTPICAYTCGWCNFLGNTAGDAGFASGFASFLASAISVSGGTLVSPQAQVGIAIAFTFLCSALNFFRIDKVGWINAVAAVTHVASIIIVIVAPLALAPKLADGKTVFTGFYNGTGFTEKSYVSAIGITAGMFIFSGYEAAAHMAEETEGSATKAPMNITYSVLATGLGGLSLILTLLFAMPNVGTVSDYLFAAMINDDYYVPYTLSAVDPASNSVANMTANSTALPNFAIYKSGNAAVNIFFLTAGPTWGCALTWLVTINLFFAGLASVTVTSRITFAVARDGLFPGSSWISHVDPRFQSPINALILIFLVDTVLLMLGLNTEGGSAAFAAIIGLTTIGFQVSYGIPIFLKLICQPKDFPVAPISLGAWSAPFAVVACIWLFGSSFLFFLPGTWPVTADTMNWLIVVVAGFFLFALTYWIFYARFVYTGPKRVDREQHQLVLEACAKKLETTQKMTASDRADELPGVMINY